MGVLRGARESTVCRCRQATDGRAREEVHGVLVPGLPEPATHGASTPTEPYHAWRSTPCCGMSGAPGQASRQAMGPVTGLGAALCHHLLSCPTSKASTKGNPHTQACALWTCPWEHLTSSCPSLFHMLLQTCSVSGAQPEQKRQRMGRTFSCSGTSAQPAQGQPGRVVLVSSVRQ